MASGFELNEVTARRGDIVAVAGVTCTLPADGITVLAGPSGSGKSSLLRLLNRLDVPEQGTISWNGRDLANWAPGELRRRVGMVFQRPTPFEGTCADNLRVADPTVSGDRVDELLALVALAGFAGRDALGLSGGEAQRLCIARTLATSPALVLADEVTASLDDDNTRVIERLARRTATDDPALGWIWVSHDTGQIRRIADHVVVLSAGHVVASGDLTHLDADPSPVVRSAVGAP